MIMAACHDPAAARHDPAAARHDPARDPARDPAHDLARDPAHDPAAHDPAAARRKEVLAGVAPAWLPLIDLGLLDAALAGIDALGDADRFTPPAALVFEAFRFGDPADVRVVILGQDPYPTEGVAQGLSFSVPAGAKLPGSLVRIFDCLRRAGLRGAKDPESGDLRPWAVQGVLLINTALTTRVGARRAHAKIWKPFTTELLRRLCAERSGAGLQFLLWGDDARRHGGAARRYGHTVREWTHPSPLSDNRLPGPARFAACPHFAEAGAAGAAVEWDNLAPVTAFTDGACTRNGKPGARASFAAVLTGAQFGAAAVIRGELRPAEYRFVDDGRPELGVCATPVWAAPSNNRGELLGIIYALCGLLRGCVGARAELVSDSEISIKTLTQWFPKRLRDGTDGDLKNLDLVTIAWRLLGALRARAPVTLTHVRSHQRGAPADERERALRAGNEAADAHATGVLAKAAAHTVEVLDAPAALRVLASP